MIDGIVNEAKYRDILQEHLYSSVQQFVLRDDWAFQEDNDPSQWLTVNNFEVLKWPS